VVFFLPYLIKKISNNTFENIKLHKYMSSIEQKSLSRLNNILPFQDYSVERLEGLTNFVYKVTG